MSHVRIEKPRPHTSVIILDRPERMNSMAFDLAVPLHEAIAEVARDNDTWCVILTGTGRGFCSGADTQTTEPPPNIEGMTLTRIATHSMSILADLVPAMRRMPQPVIGAINGAAIGGGLCLTLGADIRLAAESAYFRAAGINNGLTATELGLSFLLPRAIGSSRAFEIMLSGRDVSASEAAAIGLVSRTVPDAELMDAALDLADQINGWSTQGVQLTKKMMWSGLETASLQAAIELESHTQLFVRLTTKNFEEATRARKEGRKPVFED
ncbi:MAG: enoyl-CoA hydratase [Deltaproteobacteria bacterium]|nr:enoyl-CoA hydratase [Deltaproteobacteria bacterium]MBW2694938.1 enoyl-CoA hydratase [Deltaproteobacteria bacterium]